MLRIVFSALALLGAFASFGGCSDNASPDAGLLTDGGHIPSDSGLSACSQPLSVLPVYAPPLHDAGLCTSAQLAAYVNTCISTLTASQDTCTAFLAQDGNADCVNKCLYVPQRNADGSDAHAQNYGALILEYGAAYLNEPGYFKLLGGSDACASAYYDSFNCSAAACALCPVDDGEDAQCNLQVTESGGTCAVKYDTFDTVCAGEQGLINQAHNDVLSNALGVVTLFCGPPSSDAGAH